MIIFRYLCRELYASLLAITLILLIIFITNQFIHYLKDAASGHITMTAVMQIMSLQIPLLLGYLLPLGLYLSVLITYGRLYTDREMTVLFSCGVSRAQLLGMTLLIALAVTIVVAVLMLWLEPIIQGYRTQILDQAITNISIQKVVPKRFQQLPGHQVLYTDRLSRDDETMHHVFTAKMFEGDKSWNVMLARAARDQNVVNLSGKFVVFDDGRRYSIIPGKKAIQKIEFQRYGMRLTAPARHLDDWPNNVPTTDLLHLVRTEKRIDRLRALEAMLQWRLAMPVSVILFALLAFPLSEVRPRSGKFARLFPAILIYIIYADLLFLGRAWIEHGTISASLGLWWIHGAVLLLAVVLNIQRIGWYQFFRLLKVQRVRPC